MALWINEIHYDNTGADTGEFIEIAGTAGTDLTGYSLVLYNGGSTAVAAAAAVSYNTKALTGSIANHQGGLGTLAFSYPTDGIQNGAPDGVALVAPDGTVVQFLSYEGVLTASNGPAAGITSVNIGVTEPGTGAIGQSLQLGGTGTQYADFAWQTERAKTDGAVNANQSFGGGISLSISDPTVAEGNSGTTLLTYTVTASGPAPTGGISFDIATADGTATAGSDYVAKSLTGQSIAAGATAYSFSVTVNGDTAFEPGETVLVNLANVVGAAVADGQGAGTITNDDTAPPSTPPWINEIHYDNSGGDVGETIEIAGAAGIDLTGYSLVLYNGSNTQTAAPVYNTKTLSGVIADQQGGYGTVAFTYPTDGIQNGSFDGVALVAPDGSVVQFLSYEGVFTASGGPANGMTSTDIVVSEASTSPVGASLQLGGVGTKYADFTWQAATTATSNAVNSGQTFGVPVPTVSIADASVSEGDAGTKVLSFTVTRSDITTAFSVNYATANGTATAGSDYVAAAGVLTFTAGGPATQTVSVTLNGDTTTEGNETFTVALSGLANATGTTVIGDGGAVGTIQNDDVSITKIYTIQGSGHGSSFAGTAVTTQGVVTAVDSNGFYIQDVSGDGSTATSDGLFVFTNSAPPASAVVGALVNVTGTVVEFTPGGADPGALSLTELSGAIAVTQLSTGNTLPTAVVLSPPTSDLQAGAAYYESLEGMLVKVVAPQATGPTNSFGEIWTVASNGVGATGVNARGDIILSGGAPNFGYIDTVGGDFNPERIQIDPGLGMLTPSVSVGARLNDVTGVMNYSFGNYEVLATAPVTVATPSPLVKTGTTLTGDANHLLVASYNAENIDPNDGAARFAVIGSEIVTKLNAPDIIALQEIQDNNGTSGGTTGSTVTSASQTLSMIVTAINNAGGPQYAYIDNPFIGDDTNGGEPGGNIRTAYIYRIDRVSLVSGSVRTVGANGESLTAADLSQQTNTNNPFYGSRPPLVADFSFAGQTVTLVNNHFTSKGGSGVLMGSLASPPSAGEVQRAGQAQAVNTFVDGLLAANAGAKVIVTGDLNDFEFEQPLTVLKGGATISNYNGNGDPFNATATYTPGGAPILTDLQDMLPADQRFDYIFDGQAQTLDHMLATGNLAAGAQFEPVHINAEFVDQTSDHDPLVGRFVFNTAPVAQAGAAAVDEDQVLNGQATATDAEQPPQALTYSLVSGPANGQIVFKADGSYSYTPTANYNGGDSFTFKASDASLTSNTAQVSLTVRPVNDAPIAANDTAAVAERGVVLIDVLANDTDVDTGDAKTLVSVSATTKGSTVAISGGKVSYTADADNLALLTAGQTAIDSFTYVVKDAAGATSTATVQVTVTGLANGPTQSGGNGTDTLTGTAADETLDGGNGTDTLYGLGGADTLIGGNGTDSLYGGAGIDILIGGNGSDLLDGGAGADTLTGDNGGDTFVFAGAFGKDLVTDFDNSDVLQFSKLLFANYGAVISQAAQVGGSVVITYDAANTVTLAGVALGSLSAGDFAFV